MRTLILCLLLWAGEVFSGPQVAIIIDDLGNRGVLDRRAVALPGPVAMSVLPHTPHARQIAERANAAGKEVLVHLPMQRLDELTPGPEVLSLASTRTVLERLLDGALASVPHASGVNNHMGSLITRHPGHMGWLMSALARRGGLFFVDSRTTSRTVAAMMAREKGVPVLSRDVFLDDDRDPAAIAAAFDRLEATARRKGRAVAIGHPYPATLALLEERLPRLPEAGFELVKLSTLLQSERSQWPAYSSP